MKPTILKQMNVMAIVALLFLSACTNLEKAIDRGDYDLAVRTAVKKLRGKTKKKAKYVAALEEGFEKATRLDMSRIKSLKQRNTAAAWEKVNRIAQGIDYRQNLISPLLPVFDREGYKANFKFVKTDGLIQESSEMAANLLYDEAKTYLALGRKGDKYQARKAYDSFQRIKKYNRNYRDIIALSAEAHELGTVHILYRVNNHTNGYLPRAAVDRLRNINTNGLNSFWQKYYIGKAGRETVIDYELNLNVQNIEMSPELINEKEYVDRKRIIVGHSKVTKKEIEKDSLGNDITVEKIVTVPNYQWISADVLRTIQKREACVHANIVVKDKRNGGIVNRQRISSTINFENCFIEFFGDRRALSPESLQHLNNRFLPFPSDRQMLTDAACQLAPQVDRKIRNMNLS